VPAHLFRQYSEVLLAAGHRVVALDQRGHGVSDKPQHGLRMTRLGQDVSELIDHLDLHDVTLVGHSMGVSVSLAMFSMFGVDRVARFVAIDQSPKITNDEEWSWGVRKVTWANVYDCVHFRADWGEPELESRNPRCWDCLVGNLQVLEHRPDPTVLIIVGRQPELGEDPARRSLDRLVTDVQQRSN
jgi:pimeloyl-ACP methyl ester carboxylesterase